MKAVKKQVAASLLRQDAPTLLRLLADAMESGDPSALPQGFEALDLAPENLSRLKISLKQRGARFDIKLRAKYPARPDETQAQNSQSGPASVSVPVSGPASGPGPGPGPGPDPGPTSGPTPGPTSVQLETVTYKVCKKCLARSFHALARSASAGSLPRAGDMESFLEESERMISYPGKGDEHYPDYKAVCERLEQAWEAGDVAGVKAALDGLARRKKRCHGLRKQS